MSLETMMTLGVAAAILGLGLLLRFLVMTPIWIVRRVLAFSKADSRTEKPAARDKTDRKPGTITRPVDRIKRREPAEKGEETNPIAIGA